MKNLLNICLLSTALCATTMAYADNNGGDSTDKDLQQLELTSNSTLQILQTISKQLTTVDTDLNTNTSDNNSVWSTYVTMHANDLFPNQTGEFLLNPNTYQNALFIENFGASADNTTPVSDGNSNGQAYSGLMQMLSYCNSAGANAGNCNTATVGYYSVDNILGSSDYSASNVPEQTLNDIFTSQGLDSADSNQNLSSAPALSAAYSALNQIITTRTPLDTGDSQMSALQNTVNASMTQSWLQQIATAPDSQVNRQIAVLMAVQNYIELQRYQAEQTQNALQAMELVELTKLANAANQKSPPQTPASPH